jgi:hypothetical protein
MSEPNATTTELPCDARRWINDREYHARYDAQKWLKRSPEARAFHEAMQRRQVERENWIEAGMRDPQLRLTRKVDGKTIAESFVAMTRFVAIRTGSQRAPPSFPDYWLMVAR